MSTDIDSNNDRDTPWHGGELAAQGRAGASEKITPLGSKLIRDHMPDQHRQMFEQLPMLIIGAEGVDGNLWASALFGKPGFIRSPAPTQLTIATSLPPSDPLASSITSGTQVGLLGIQLETRRRNRANGTITATEGECFSVTVSQSFGNCAKYITRRTPESNPHYGGRNQMDFTDWPESVVDLINHADTFFITTTFNDGRCGKNRGTDVSHRGGEPGFLQFDAQQRLLIPDYAGNNFFNTVGNLAMDHRAGLLFMDFQQGHSLHLTGTAEVVWREDEELPFTDIDRMIRVTLKRGRMVQNALPLLWQRITGEA
ncbi:pyridoxamine 5'-phosphate oxidase family protein [Porticoccus sp.]